MAAAGSTTQSLDLGWVFGGEYATGSEAPGYSTSSWPEVSLPHCVVPLSWRNWDHTTWEKRWIYRRQLNLPASLDSLRLFLDFDGSLTSTTPYLNGTALHETLGGYLPFSYEITSHGAPGPNQLAVVVDGIWQNVPPGVVPGDATKIDFLQPAGLYRHVNLRTEPAPAFLDEVFVDPSAPASGSFAPSVAVTIDTSAAIDGYRLEVSLSPSGSTDIVTSAQADVPTSGAGTVTVTVELPPQDLGRWSFDAPKLYEASVSLLDRTGSVVDTATVRTGFRQAAFLDGGFFLNGERVLLFGLNRHQLYPFVGMAMPDRVQRRDAEILKSELNCNMVRCSHYPQAPAFLDACDELGLGVFQETPGWGFLGDDAWDQLWFANVAGMVGRDRSRPSVMVWGAQPNETEPGAGVATTARNTAKSADARRQTSGTMKIYDYNPYVQDVYAYDDYPGSDYVKGVWTRQLKEPMSGKPYLVTESVGALNNFRIFRRTSNQVTQQGQAHLHAVAHDQAQSTGSTYAGLLGWCAFDYASVLAGSAAVWDAMKTAGVVDTFRVVKPGAACYQSQVDPGKQAVVQPAFFWDFGPTSPVTSLGSSALIFSNCEQLEVYLDGQLRATLQPLRDQFPHLGWAPFALDTSIVDASQKPELRLDGYLGGKVVVSHRYSGDTTGDTLRLAADDDEIAADGSDATRVRFLSVDRYGMPRPYVSGVVSLSLDGPGVLVGDTLVDLSETGGSGAVFVRGAAGNPGQLVVHASHPTLGAKQVVVTTQAGAGTPPPFPLGSDYIGVSHNADNPAVRTWQQHMSSLGRIIAVDGIYGPQSEGVCRAFQASARLSIDGLLGPRTWRASFIPPN